jgi:CRISPR system Cascade subunit CasE
LFSDHADRTRDFLYRVEQSEGRPLIYAVSVREPDKKHELWFVASKCYEPKINAGMQLAFMLRVNPVRTKRDDANKQHRHDVVMEAKTHLRERGVHKPLQHLIQEEGTMWLLSRAGRCGFTFKPEHIRIDGYQQHRFLKGKGNKQVSHSTLEFSGVLTVADPDRFFETLYSGIGPGKGFGCGLMLVKRV